MVDLFRLVPERLSFAYRYFPRARHVLKTEGAATLLKKIVRRLKTTSLSVAARPMLLDLRGPLIPLAFPLAERPAASIVVPVFNQLRFTHHCLASLHRHGSEHAFEVIVVDDCSTDETASALTAFENLRLIRNEENLGFVHSSNRGAQAARGRIIVLLNNDTQVQSGWLDALIETFSLKPDAGLVGSRLLYPDGRQQEAGGIVFADGSAWNYGHLDDPYKPQYSYLRPVDYCSGASLGDPAFLVRGARRFRRILRAGLLRGHGSCVPCSGGGIPGLLPAPLSRCAL